MLIADLADLYRDLGHKLERIVRSDVRAPEPVVEDACQFAWSRLADHAARIRRESALAWLATTATREARRLASRDCRELSLDADDGSPMPALAPGPYEVVERRERLDCIALLPERQQRLLWLHALGLSYAEMAAHTGDTRRTVERQLLRAKRAIRALAAA
jgi:RNA polymerase sigma factor (sigma-70 family)